MTRKIQSMTRKIQKEAKRRLASGLNSAFMWMS
mgnify:CR=1 FL=1